MNGKETFDNVKGIAQPGCVAFFGAIEVPRVWPSDKKPPFKLCIAGSGSAGTWSC